MTATRDDSVSSSAKRTGIATDVFTGTPSGYVRRVGLALLARWWWAWLLPVAACCVAATVEAVWIFVALMLVCLLYPGLVMFIYMNYALSPEARRTLLPHTVTLAPDGLTVNYHDDRNTPPETFTREDITSVECGRNDIVFHLRTPRYHHIAIPVHAVPEAERHAFMVLAETFNPEAPDR